MSVAAFRSIPLPVGQLSLAAVLKCGQSFRWSVHTLTDPQASPAPLGTSAHATHEYRLCLEDRVICLRQTADELLYRSVFPQSSDPEMSSSESLRNSETVAFIRDYFQLDVDLQQLYNRWSSSDPIFCGIRERFSGIRILRQNPWETLVSFICSANNNISRISKMVQNLCTHFSSPLLQMASPNAATVHDVEQYYAFPPPSALAGKSVSAKLRELGFGYRAEYIQRTAHMLIEEHGTDAHVIKWLESLRARNTDDARGELLKLMGVGRKVADCILLMSLDKAEVIPVDTHVYQIAVKHYGMRGISGSKVTMTPKLYDDVNRRLAAMWGSYAGWAHSVLFTADLKSFATYGVEASKPSSSPVKLHSPNSMLPTPSPSPSPSKRKRKHEDVLKNGVMPSNEAVIACVPPTADCLIDRVKRRRRIQLQVT